MDTGSSAPEGVMELIDTWGRPAKVIAGATAGVLVATLLIVLGWRLLHQSWPDVLDFLKISVWPLVVCAGLALFREPLSRFLGSIAGRVSKLSAFDIELELAPVAVARPIEMPTI